MAVSVDRWIARLKAVEPHERQELLAELSRVELEAVVLQLCQLSCNDERIVLCALKQLANRELPIARSRRRWWQFWRRA